MTALKLQEVADKIAALQELTKRSGFQTGRSQKEILAPLNSEELAAVARLLVNRSRREEGQ